MPATSAAVIEDTESFSTVLSLVSLVASAPSAARTAQAEPIRPASPASLSVVPTFTPITTARPQTFRTFVVGPCNAVAYNAVLSVVKAPAIADPILWLTGADGMGKTHLLHAIAAYAPKHLNGAEAILVTGEEFIRDYDRHLQRGLMAAFRQRYRRAGLLLLDGMGAFAGHDTAADELACTVTALTERQRHTIMADGRVPATIVGLLPRFITAVRKARIVTLMEPDQDDATRACMMRKTAEAWNLVPEIGSSAEDWSVISEAALSVLGSRLRGSFRDAETALMHLAAESMARTTVDTAPLAVKVAAFINREPYHTPKSPQVEALIGAVSYSYSVERDRLLGRGREMNEAYARQMLMYLLSADLGLSAKHIGKKILGRDHSTVLYGKAKIAREVAEEQPGTLSSIDDIRKVAVVKLSEATQDMVA